VCCKHACARAYTPAHRARAPAASLGPQVATRNDVLRRLWPMIALLQSPTDRATAFAASWRTALDMHLHAAEAAAKGARGCGCAALRLLAPRSCRSPAPRAPL
jgi:hypothetical protein